MYSYRIYREKKLNHLVNNSPCSRMVKRYNKWQIKGHWKKKICLVNKNIYFFNAIIKHMPVDLHGHILN